MVWECEGISAQPKESPCLRLLSAEWIPVLCCRGRGTKLDSQIYEWQCLRLTVTPIPGKCYTGDDSVIPSSTSRDGAEIDTLKCR